MRRYLWSIGLDRRGVQTAPALTPRHERSQHVLIPEAGRPPCASWSEVREDATPPWGSPFSVELATQLELGPRQGLLMSSGCCSPAWPRCLRRFTRKRRRTVRRPRTVSCSKPGSWGATARVPDATSASTGGSRGRCRYTGWWRPTGAPIGPGRPTGSARRSCSDVPVGSFARRCARGSSTGAGTTFGRPPV